MRATVGAIACTMTIGYGTLFYSFPVLAPEIAKAFGWSRDFVFGAFSIGLFAGAFGAPLAGRLLDHFGGRIVLSAGSLCAALALAAFSRIDSAVTFIVGIVLTQIIAGFVQYEAGFAAVAQRVGVDARRPITLITLVAGFSSTIFWPLIEWLLTITDWRSVYLILGVMNLVIALPLHAFALGSYTPAADGDMRGEAVPRVALANAPVRTTVPRRQAMLLMATAFATSGFLVSAVQTQFLGILTGSGMAGAAAVAVGALIGPAQVGARIVDMAVGGRFSAILTGMISILCMGVGVGALFFVSAGPAVAYGFAVAYGAGQGLNYIMRGIVPLQVFGAEGYGRVTGDLSSARLVASSAAPWLIAFLMEQAGVDAALLLLVLISLASLAALILLQRLTFVGRRQTEKGMA